MKKFFVKVLAGLALVSALAASIIQFKFSSDQKKIYKAADFTIKSQVDSADVELGKRLFRDNNMFVLGRRCVENINPTLGDIDANVSLWQGHGACPCTAGSSVQAMSQATVQVKSRSADEPQATKRVQTPKDKTGSRLPPTLSQIRKRQGHWCLRWSGRAAC